MVAAFFAACLIWPIASPWAQEGDDANDPLEPVNRVVFQFNQVVDGLVLKPVAQLYEFVLPKFARTGVRNFLDNLKAPVIFANDVLQGETDRAGVTLSRFMINSSLGLFGTWDFAARLGYPKHSEDFGQTLAVYGVGPGPYLVLPILGPSSPRDAAGLAVDAFVIDPVPYFITDEQQIIRYLTDLVSTRAQLLPVTDDLEANSIDLYASYRTVYRQRRESLIYNGSPPQDDTYEDIFSDDAFDEADEETP